MPVVFSGGASSLCERKSLKSVVSILKTKCVVYTKRDKKKYIENSFVQKQQKQETEAADEFMVRLYYHV